MAAHAPGRDLRTASLLVEPDGQALREIAALLDSGAITVEVEKSFPLDQVTEAHQHSESGHARGKLVLTLPDAGSGSPPDNRG